MTIKSLWQRLESWANNNAPEMLDELQGPASDIEIDELEKRLQLTLPEEFKESLLIHNGEDDGWPARVFYEYGAYLPTPEIYNTWKRRLSAAKEYESFNEDEEQRSDHQIKPLAFSERWIPIMDSNGDVIWAIDLDPGETGINGQIIEIDWESESIRVTAQSFYHFFQRYVELLEGGKINVELEKRSNVKRQMDLKTTGVHDYFENNAELEYQNYLNQLSYVEKSTKASSIDKENFSDGDEIILYGSIIPNQETNQHKMNAMYIGEITINGRLDELKNRIGNDLYHIYSVKLKVSITKRLFVKKLEYSILEYKEIEP